ncbi:MAG: hypothetical protein L0027_01010 [Candidatus Rokubacteria bacterium]|nr:hypothetical protein [Candidatus Rokubacteria bacterium]
MRAPVVRALGFESAWGRGVAAWPADARAAAAGRLVLSLGDPGAGPERSRRTPRECLWGVAAIEAMLEDGGARRGVLAGEGTALIAVTAAAYGASNRAFIERTGASPYFPYTAPAAVPAEIAIEFGLAGPQMILIGGPPATLQAIWHAAVLLDTGACAQALVLAVETFEECADLYARARRRAREPLVEAVACLWLLPGEGTLELAPDAEPAAPAPTEVRRRLGESFACEPLAALAHARATARATDPVTLRGVWRGERARLTWSAAWPGR